MSTQAHQIYQSFLLRCWFIPPATTSEPPVWRFELQEVTDEPRKHGFSDLEQLKAFIAAKLTTIAVSNNRDSELS